MTTNENTRYNLIHSFTISSKHLSTQLHEETNGDSKDVQAGQRQNVSVHIVRPHAGLNVTETVSCVLARTHQQHDDLQTIKPPQTFTLSLSWCHKTNYTAAGDLCLLSLPFISDLLVLLMIHDFKVTISCLM